MNEKDDIILEYLEEVDVAEPPKVIYWNLVETGTNEFSLRTLRRRLDRLNEEDLVRIVNEKAGYYEITGLGRDYLSGDADLQEQRST